LRGSTWPTTSQSNSMRTAASDCLTEDAADVRCGASTWAPTSCGRTVAKVRPRASHQQKKAAQARA